MEKEKYWWDNEKKLTTYLIDWVNKTSNKLKIKSVEYEYVDKKRA